MEEVRDKAKGIMKKLNPFTTSTPRFKGEGHRLGSTDPAGSQPPPAHVNSQQLEWKKLQQERWEAKQLEQQRKAESKSAKSIFHLKSKSKSAPAQPASTSSSVSAVDAVAPRAATVFSSRIDESESYVHGGGLATCASQVDDNSVVSAETETETETGTEMEEVQIQVATFLSAGASDAAVQVVVRLLRNIAREPTSEKFRKVRMGNPKIQETIGSAPGGVEFLEFLGFCRSVSQEEGQEQESLLIMDEPGEHHLRLLNQTISFLDSHTTASTTTTSSTMIKTSLAPEEREVRVFFTDPGKSVVRAEELWEGFYELSLDEVKKLTAAKKKKLEESQMLIPKSLREKRAAAARSKYKFSVIRVQFPDNVVLQAMFLPKEPTSTLYSFVKGSLKHQVPFQLIDPAGTGTSRAVSSSVTIEEARLVPTALLKFQTDAPDFAGLRADLLSKLEPLVASPF